VPEEPTPSQRDEDDDDEARGEDDEEDENAGVYSGAMSGHGDEDDEDYPLVEEPQEPALRSPRMQRPPNAADVREAFEAEQEESLETFVSRYAPFVERSPEDYAFELNRISPRLDSDGNPCAGFVKEFWNTTQLTLEWLRMNYAPGRYQLAVRGIGKDGVRGRYIGIFNGITIAKDNPGNFKPPGDAETGGRRPGGNGSAGMNEPGMSMRPMSPWAGAGGGMAQQQHSSRGGTSDQDVIGMVERFSDKLAASEREKVGIVQQQAASELAEVRSTVKQMAEQMSRPQMAPVAAAPPRDDEVTKTALVMLSKQAEAGPRAQSETEQRLLEQINSLRADLGMLQAKHVDETSRLRADHMQEVFKERESSTSARGELVASYEKSLETERRRSDELRSALTAQHQSFVSNLELQYRGQQESTRASYEARIAALQDQYSGARDTISQERSAHSDEVSRLRLEFSNELGRLRTELSETKSQSDTHRSDLLLAKVEAQTAEVKGQLAGDSLSNAGKMLANVKSFADALGYVPAGGVAAVVGEAAPEGVGGTIVKMAGAAAEAARSPEFAKLLGAVADRLKRAGEPQTNPSETAAGVAQWQQYYGAQRAASAVPPAPAVPQIAAQSRPAAPPPPAQAPQSPPAGTEGLQTAQDALEDAAIEEEPPESFMRRMAAVFDVSIDTIRGAVAGASDADVWGFLGVNPQSLTRTGQEYASTVLVWLRSPSPTPPAS
jgi:hypothetical protein